MQRNWWKRPLRVRHRLLQLGTRRQQLRHLQDHYSNSHPFCHKNVNLISMFQNVPSFLQVSCLLTLTKAWAKVNIKLSLDNFKLFVGKSSLPKVIAYYDLGKEIFFLFVIFRSLPMLRPNPKKVFFFFPSQQLVGKTHGSTAIQKLFPFFPMPWLCTRPSNEIWNDWFQLGSNNNKSNSLVPGLPVGSSLRHIRVDSSISLENELNDPSRPLSSSLDRKWHMTITARPQNQLLLQSRVVKSQANK